MELLENNEGIWNIIGSNTSGLLISSAVGILVGGVIVGALAHRGLCPFQMGALKKKPEFKVDPS